MTIGYFTKSIFQETCVLYNFMVTNLSDLLVNPSRRDASHTTKLFLPVNDTKTFTLIESIKKESKKEKVSEVRQKECQNELESSMFIDIL